MSSTASSTSAPRAASGSGTLVPALVLALLGFLMVGTVGFAHVEALHNAAHDVRHASGFPCH